MRGAAVLLAAGVLAAVALGITLRLDDPLSSRVIPAEDPYTHMALVGDHLRDGELDPMYEGADLYPPGFHAVVASYHVYTGADLHLLFLLGPVLLGAIGIVGAAWLTRPLGRSAAVVAAAAYAVTPELVFRTTMMAPTALDLAVIPFLLGALVRTAEGRLGWGLPSAAGILLLVFSHPWVLALFALAGAALLVLQMLLERRTTLLGVLVGTAILGAGTGLAITGCSDMCGPGLLRIDSDKTQGDGTGNDVGLGLALVAASASLPALALSPGLRRWWETRRADDGTRMRSRRWRQTGVGVALLVGFGWLLRRALEGGLPGHVDLSYMMGRPLAAVAVLGLAVAPFVRHPVAQLAVAWSAATFPLVVLNPLDSPFWPHRTAAYLAVGLALLAAAATAALVRLATLALTAWADHRRRRLGSTGRRRVLRSPAVSVAAALVALSLSGVIVGATHEPRPWYRLYDDCESEALQAIGAEAGPDDLYITAAWQSKLVVAAYADDASRIWFAESAFTPKNVENMGWLAKDRPVFLVADPVGVKRAAGAADAAGEGSPAALGLQQTASYCGGTITVHQVPPR